MQEVEYPVCLWETAPPTLSPRSMALFFTLHISEWNFCVNLPDQETNT